MRLWGAGNGERYARRVRAPLWYCPPTSEKGVCRKSRKGKAAAPPLSLPHPFLRIPYQQAVVIQPEPVQQISTQTPSHEISRWQYGPMFLGAAWEDTTAARTATSMNRVERRRASRCFSMMFSFVVGDLSLSGRGGRGREGKLHLAARNLDVRVDESLENQT